MKHAIFLSTVADGYTASVLDLFADERAHGAFTMMAEFWQR
jgi:hypothetical protein